MANILELSYKVSSNKDSNTQYMIQFYGIVIKNVILKYILYILLKVLKTL